MLMLVVLQSIQLILLLINTNVRISIDNTELTKRENKYYTQHVIESEAVFMLKLIQKPIMKKTI